MKLTQEIKDRIDNHDFADAIERLRKEEEEDKKLKKEVFTTIAKIVAHNTAKDKTPFDEHFDRDFRIVYDGLLRAEKYLNTHFYGE